MDHFSVFSSAKYYFLLGNLCLFNMSHWWKHSCFNCAIINYSFLGISDATCVFIIHSWRAKFFQKCFFIKIIVTQPYSFFKFKASRENYALGNLKNYRIWKILFLGWISLLNQFFFPNSRMHNIFTSNKIRSLLSKNRNHEPKPSKHCIIFQKAGFLGPRKNLQEHNSQMNEKHFYYSRSTIQMFGYRNMTIGIIKTSKFSRILLSLKNIIIIKDIPNIILPP